MGPRVVVKRFSNNVTYRVRDLVSAEQRQLTRDQFKVVELPSSFGAPEDPNSPFLPRLLVSDDAVRVTVSAPDEADKVSGLSHDNVPLPLSEEN